MPEAGLSVVFVCQRCNALSPMAATLADGLGGASVQAGCMGIDPEGRILPGALTALREIGLPTDELVPSPVSRARLEASDVVVAVGLDPEEDAVFDGLEAEAWELETPGGQLATFREARDELGLRVRALLRRHGFAPDEQEDLL